MNIRNHLIEIQCNQRDISDVAHALVHSLIFFRTYGKFNYKHEESYSCGTLGFEEVNCDRLNFSYVRCNSPSLVESVNSKLREFVDKMARNSSSGILSLEFYTKRPNRWPFNDTKIVWELWKIKIVISHPNNIHEAHDASDPSNVLPFFTPGANQHQQQQQKQPMQYPQQQQHHQHHHQQQQQILQQLQLQQPRFSSPNASPNSQDSSSKLEEALTQRLFDIIRIVNSEKCSLPEMPTQPNVDNVFDTSYADVQPYLHNLSYKISEFVAMGSPAGGNQNAKFGEGNTVSDSSTQSTLRKFLRGTLEL